MKKCPTGDGRPTAPPAYAYCKQCLIRIGKGDVPTKRTRETRIALRLMRMLGMLFGVKREDFDRMTDELDAMSDAERKAARVKSLNELRDFEEPR